MPIPVYSGTAVDPPPEIAPEPAPEPEAEAEPPNPSQRFVAAVAAFAREVRLAKVLHSSGEAAALELEAAAANLLDNRRARHA